MLTAVILICSHAIGYSACDTSNATTVLRTPIASANPGTCFMQAQAYVAETAIRPEGDDVIRIACVRSPA